MSWACLLHESRDFLPFFQSKSSNSDPPADRSIATICRQIYFFNRLRSRKIEIAEFLPVPCLAPCLGVMLQCKAFCLSDFWNREYTKTRKIKTAVSRINKNNFYSDSYTVYTPLIWNVFRMCFIYLFYSFIFCQNLFVNLWKDYTNITVLKSEKSNPRQFTRDPRQLDCPPTTNSTMKPFLCLCSVTFIMWDIHLSTIYFLWIKISIFTKERKIILERS